MYETSEHTPDISYLQKAADFVSAFMLGFDVDVRILSGLVSYDCQIGCYCFTPSGGFVY